MLVKVMTPARRKQLDLKYSSKLSDTQMAHSEWTEYIHTKSNSWVNAEGQSNSSECSGQLWISQELESVLVVCYIRSFLLTDSLCDSEMIEILPSPLQSFA